MSEKNKIKMMDANEATASVAHRMNEVIVIYPITPSSPMGEWAEAWSSANKRNIWGVIPEVQEMQSEAGAAGACHGSVQAGSLTTTFTASQGLLLMLPNMYKIAGELTPFVMHVAARSLAYTSLSIFGDHSDVMAARQTGFGMLCSNSVQEAGDFAAIAQTASLRSRVPFIHFFDGFRTSHEIKKISLLSDDEIKAMMKGVDKNLLLDRALRPESPVIRGTAQNPDVYFQGREALNSYYDNVENIIQEEMDKLAKITDRAYKTVEYVGPADADTVIVTLGSSAETAEETIEVLNKQGYKAGVLKIRLYRPFPKKSFMDALPKTVKTISVLDRTKEAGSAGEPLYLDVMTTLSEAFSNDIIKTFPKVYGGRYGLSSKEFTPGMVKAIYDNAQLPKGINSFSVGIDDDVTHKSLSYDNSLDTEGSDVVRAMFYGLGSDGTVSANKNSIKIIAEDAGKFGQGYFVYDSKKAGAMTVSHLRFSDKPIRAAYLIDKADFIACHHFPFISKIDILKNAKKGATFLLNSPHEGNEVWNYLPVEVQKTIIEKEIKFYAINAVDVARKTGMGMRINTIMQTCFFAISNVLDKDLAISHIKQSIKDTYSKKSLEIVEKNYIAVDESLKHLHRVEIGKADSKISMSLPVSSNAPDFVKNVTGEIIAERGNELSVSAFADVADGTWPVGTTKYEKRRIATEIPIWEEDICIQCGKCSLVCPHAVIRFKVASKEQLENAPSSFRSVAYKGKEFPDKDFILQISPEDCTGCNLCVTACPVKDKNDPSKKAINMAHIEDHIDDEIKNWDFFETLPYVKRSDFVNKSIIKNTQMMQPLFEFSGACSGCGETPYIKLLTQLFGDRMVIANATGCSSIYGGNLPTTPYTKSDDGKGPAWANSLFEDNAEFGLGMKFSIDLQTKSAIEAVESLRSEIGSDFVDELLHSVQTNDVEYEAQRERIATLKSKLEKIDSDIARQLIKNADYLLKKSLWIIGGDGWAYDIGFGGLDHTIASGKNVNILVMDTGAYSNTGGQQSKATPLGASAKFASNGKEMPQKDLGLIAMSYGNVYVGQIAFGANDMQTIKTLNEAEAFDGPSLIIAYSHCIAQGFNLNQGIAHQKLAVDSGAWSLYRYHPDNIEAGKPALMLDSKPASIPLSDFVETEGRFSIIKRQFPDRYDDLLKKAEAFNKNKRAYYEHMANFVANKPEE